MPNLKLSVLLAALLVVVAGCKSGPSAKPATPAPDAPPAAVSAPATGEAAAPAQPAAAAAPDSSPDKTAALSGHITYPTRQALPPEAVIRVQLLEAASGGTPGALLGEQVIETNGQQVPIAFKVPYNPKSISAKKRYRLFATAEVGGETVMTSAGTNGVLTAGNPKTRNLVLKAVKKK